MAKLQGKSASNKRHGYNDRRKQNPKVSYTGDFDSARDEKEVGKQQWKKGSNDPKWYANSPQLLRDAASFPFSSPTGAVVDLHNPLLQTISNQGKFTIPGLNVIYLSPAVGYAIDAESPVNIAAQSAYSFVRYANSGSRNYDNPDLMIYLLAMSQVYSYIVYLQRLYAAALKYTYNNRYLPDAVLLACHVDVDNLRQHLADFRMGINVLINKTAQFAVPNTMPYFNRMAFLYKQLYTEGTSGKDQMYMYAPLSFWKYELNVDKSGMLRMYEVPGHGALSGTAPLADYDDLIRYGEDMIGRLIQSEDSGVMSGDILKAYKGNIIRIMEVPESFDLEIVFDIGVLEQMKNSTCVHGTTNREIVDMDIAHANVIQDPTHSFLQSEPSISVANRSDLPEWQNNALQRSLQILQEDRLLTTTSVDVTPELVIESTRLMTIGFNYQNDTADLPANISLYCGSEVAWYSRYFYFDVDSSGVRKLNNLVNSYPTILFSSLDADALTLWEREVNVMGYFRFHPMVHVIMARESTTTPGAVNYTDGGLQYDVDNYALVDFTMLSKLHDISLLSMFNISQTGWRS